MKPLSQILEFKFAWRDYQQHFLDNYQSHIIDNHLHVVAPPGSGKTILGLEMLLRVGNATLVLSPTLTIRNQWKNRMREFFISDMDFTDYTINIKQPKRITFSTYQSLHSLHKTIVANGDIDGLVNYMDRHQIKTIVLDEAHHLKNEWWKCLMDLKAIEGITIIALTATPPYDSSSHELEKYFQLCGPIDDEIAVPDLVGNGDLCPHQDFIHFSRPDDSQIRYIVAYRERIIQFMDAILKDDNFKNVLLQHPSYMDPMVQLEQIYEDPSFFSSILIFLNSYKIPIDKEKLKVLGIEARELELPALNYEWMQILFRKLLIDQREELLEFESVLKEVETKLKKIGVFNHGKIDFIGSDQLYRSLANSPAKLKSIQNIVLSEYSVLQERLRMVVLTDFIRKEFLGYTQNGETELNKIGVVPIFQSLRTSTFPKHLFGVLSGSLVILHRKAMLVFSDRMGSDQYTIDPLTVDGDFYRITPSATGKNALVAAVTRLFDEGIVKILIGTKALLGEGWDAPAINSLVLASYVGSFVSSNQMRGRAIRTQADNDSKTANIWHLACLDPTVIDGGKDLERLKRRFDAFTGVSLKGEAYIENGLDRLLLPNEFGPDHAIDVLNKEMTTIATDRSQLGSRWISAISNGKVLQRELKVFYKGKLPYNREKKLLRVNMAKYMAIEISLGLGLYLSEFFLKNMSVILQKGVLSVLYLLMGGVMIGFAPKTYKAIKLYVGFGNTQKRTLRIGKAILNVLQKTKAIRTDPHQFQVAMEDYGMGTFACYLKGATTHESSLFLDILEEVLAPVENPRYLLSSRNWLRLKWTARNYYVVPSYFGKRKSDAELFHQSWEKHVGKTKLLYTRTLDGRKELLKARLSHIKYQFEEVSRKVIAWK